MVQASSNHVALIVIWTVFVIGFCFADELPVNWVVGGQQLNTSLILSSSDGAVWDVTSVGLFGEINTVAGGSAYIFQEDLNSAAWVVAGGHDPDSASGTLSCSIATSLDGRNWTCALTQPCPFFLNCDATSVALSPSVWVVVGNVSRCGVGVFSPLLVSNDRGVSWQPPDTVGVPRRNVNQIVYVASLLRWFLAGGDDIQFATASSDAMKWTPIVVPQLLVGNGVSYDAWSNTLCVSGETALQRPAVYCAPFQKDVSQLNFTLVPIPNSDAVANTLTYANGVWVTGSDGLLYSQGLSQFSMLPNAPFNSNLPGVSFNDVLQQWSTVSAKSPDPIAVLDDSTLASNASSWVKPPIRGAPGVSGFSTPGWLVPRSLSTLNGQSSSCSGIVGRSSTTDISMPTNLQGDLAVLGTVSVSSSLNVGARLFLHRGSKLKIAYDASLSSSATSIQVGRLVIRNATLEVVISRASNNNNPFSAPISIPIASFRSSSYFGSFARISVLSSDTQCTVVSYATQTTSTTLSLLVSFQCDGSPVGPSGLTQPQLVAIVVCSVIGGIGLLIVIIAFAKYLYNKESLDWSKPPKYM